MRTILKGLSKEVYNEKSARIANNLFQTDEWKQAKTIGITISIFPEVDTYSIIHKAWEEDKQVAVVKCVPKTRSMDFYVIESFDQTEKGYSGLIEPLPEKATKIEPSQIDLIFVPGVAYSKAGFRLGFGGGYYDRFLPTYNGPTLSLAFEEQIVPEVPVEEHDFKVQKIVSEKEVIECV